MNVASVVIHRVFSTTVVTEVRVSTCPPSCVTTLYVCDVMLVCDPYTCRLKLLSRLLVMTWEPTDENNILSHRFTDSMGSRHHARTHTVMSCEEVKCVDYVSFTDMGL
jgi:hypothetical protein